MSRHIHQAAGGEAYAVHDPGLWPGWLADDAVTIVDRARRDAGLTPERLADRTGIGRRTVIGILSSTRPASLEQMRRLCAVLGIVVPSTFAWFDR